MQSEKSAGKSALVLSGGGAHGAVEVGLHRALVELGIPFDFMVGSSIGAVNGAMIAAGLTPGEIELRWRGLRTRDVVGSRWQPLRLIWGAPSVYSNQGLRALLRSILPVQKFQDLKIPLAIVATDFETGRSVVLDKGDLIEAILASTAVPGLFPPITREGQTLVDGGVSNNVPLDVAAERGAERTIGILCHCPESPRSWGLVAVLAQSFSLALRAHFRCDLRFYQDRLDVWILDPCPRACLPLFDFDQAWTLIEPAYHHALAQLGQRLHGHLERRPASPCRPAATSSEIA
jgi:NTE family protein